MFKSIKSLEINNNFYNKYISLLNTFNKTDISFLFFSDFVKNLSNNHDIFILFDPSNNNIIGTVTLLFEQKLIHNGKYVCHIEDLIISDEYKNNRYGTLFLKFIKNYAKIKDCYKIILNCSQNIKDFYSKNNFSNRNIEMSYYY